MLGNALLISPRHKRLHKTYEALYTDSGALRDQICDIIYEQGRNLHLKNITKDNIRNVALPNILLEYKPEKFADGELMVALPHKFFNEKHFDYKVRIISPLIDDSSVLELCFMLDAISRSPMRRSVVDVILSIPYMRYARQDRVCVLGESVSAISIIRIILSHAEDLKMMQFFDVHNDTIQYVVPKNIFVSNLEVEMLFSLICGDLGYRILDKNIVVVAPDIGAAKRARKFAEHIESKFDITIVDKVRKEPGQSQSLNITGQDVDGKVCVITDDIVDSAGTLCNAANMLKDRGAEKVYACITHGIFSGDAVKKIENSAIEKLFVTDSNVFDVNGSTKIEVIPYVMNDIIVSLSTLDFRANDDVIFKIFKLLKEKGYC